MVTRKKPAPYRSMEELFYEEVVHASYVRALTDDFSVVDLVQFEDKLAIGKDDSNGN